MVEDLTPECKVEYYQYKVKFEQLQAEKGYFMPPKDMLRQAHDQRFPHIPDHVVEKLVPEAPEDEQEDVDEREWAKICTMHRRVDLQLYLATEKVTK